MATRTTYVLEDDLSGGAADETVSFELDGNAFEIDLSAKNAEKLRNAMATYVSAGRRPGMGATRPSGGTTPGDRHGASQDSAAMRHWAVENGYQVSSRGRIPANVRIAYLSA